MDEKTVDRVFAGSLDDLPRVSSKIVRIFTSSTFTDMLMERNTLMEYVYPKIKEYCREKHGLEFQVKLKTFMHCSSTFLQNCGVKYYVAWCLQKCREFSAKIEHVLSLCYTLVHLKFRDWWPGYLALVMSNSKICDCQLCKFIRNAFDNLLINKKQTWQRVAFHFLSSFS